MTFEIGPKSNDFTPVKLSITLDTFEELEEFTDMVEDMGENYNDLWTQINDIRIDRK